MATAVPRASGSTIKFCAGIRLRSARRNGAWCAAAASTKMRSRGTSGRWRALVSASKLLLPSIEKSGLGFASRLAGQKRVPRPPAIISTDARCGAELRGIGSDRAEFAQLVVEQCANFRQALFARRFESRDQRGLSIRRAYETPSVGEIHADAVDVDNVVVLAEKFCRAPDHFEFAIVGAIDANLGREVTRRQIGQDRAEPTSLLAEDFQKAERGVNAVIEAEVAVGEKHVPAHLACKRRMLLLQLALDQRVPRLPHDRAAAVARYVVVHPLRAFHLADERR